MEIAGYISAIGIGIVLGLMGSGGGILTLPLLVYLFHIDALTAATYTFFIIGVTSLAGLGSYYRSGDVCMRSAVALGIPSVSAVYFTRSYLLPTIPAELMEIQGFVITKSSFLALLFAVVMLLASRSMIGARQTANTASPALRRNYFRVILEGCCIGTVCGLIGVGGGFLIIPALVLFGKLSMKKAVGTSLSVIAVQSFIGFLSSEERSGINWNFLILMSVISIAGIMIGVSLSRKVDGKMLQPLLGYAMMLMSLWMIVKETLLKGYLI